jgi:hypothetical protein
LIALGRHGSDAFCVAVWRREFKEPISVAEFMRQKYVSKESANGLNTMQVGGVGFPSENLKA